MAPMRRLLLPPVLILLLSPAAALGGSWSDRFYVNGPDGTVSAMLVHDNALFAGGDFSSIGPTFARRIARFDGSGWSALGSGVDGVVSALGEYGGDLVAGGSFDEAGHVAASNIARWDGTDWHPIGDGIEATVCCLAEFNGDLIAGTDGYGGSPGVEPARVMRWDGTAWISMGSSFFFRVASLAVYHGELLAASVGGVTIQDENRHVFVWRWDGSDWAPLSTSPAYGTIDFPPEITSLRVADDRLYATGDQMLIDDEYHGGVCYWDGSAWNNLPGSLDQGMGYEHEWFSAVLPYNGKLLVGGSFWGPGGGTSHSIALHDVSGWAALPGGGFTSLDPYDFDGPWVSAMEEYQGEIYVAGYFPKAGDLPVSYLARWNGTQWNAVAPGGQGIRGTVSALAFWGDQLVAGGLFSKAGAREASNIAMFESGEWRPLGTGSSGAVTAVLPYGDGLVAGGGFSPEGEPATRIAYWDGSSWHALGAGLQNGGVEALAVFQGDLIAGGAFLQSGSAPMQYAARWDGTAWSSMENGLTGRVDALEVHEGVLYAAGGFGVAAWDGSRWYGVGNLVGSMFDLQSTADGLYACGNALRLWNGLAWSQVVLPHGIIYSIGIYRGDLLAGGRWLTYSDSAPDMGLMRRTASGWEPFEGGLRYCVFPIATNGHDLAVGGTFVSTGEFPAWGVALWQEPTAISLAALSVARRGSDAVITWEIAGDPEPGVSFDVYRESAGRARERLTQRALSGKRRYEFIDRTCPHGETAYWIAASERNGTTTWNGPLRLDAAGFPAALQFSEGRPNPFTGFAAITYSLPAPGPVRVTIYDISGREVVTLLDRELPAGVHMISWNGRNDSGEPAASGMYVAALKAAGQTLTRKLVLTR